MMESFNIKYLGFLIGIFIFSILINSILLRFAVTLGIRDAEYTLKRWDSQTKPSLGGISFFIAFLLSIISYFIAFNETMVFFDIKALGIILATTIGFLMGLADDAYDTHPLLKSSTQLLCSLLLIYTGTYIHLFQYEYLNYLLTIFWIIGIMNSINMLDNMDGISTIVSIFVFVSTLITIYYTGDVRGNVYFILISGVVMSLFGFLVYNWNPSKMYMGDTGSQFLGVILAASGIEFLWNFPIQSPKAESTTMQILLPILAFLITLTDTTTVTINRIIKGVSPFVGGRDHTTHHLSYLGLSDKNVARLMIGISIVSTILLILLCQGKFWNKQLVIGASLYCLIIFIGLYSTTKLSKKKDK